MVSVGELLERKRGIGPGFDFLRVALAFSIVCAHSYQLNTGLENVQSGHPAWFLVVIQVPMFFALSGFLVTGSALRLKLRDFILNRAMRIVPALAVDIFVAALVLGPIFTVLPLSEYFTSREFKMYFFNIVGFPNFVLPSVFKDNPFPATVNGSLWTVPFEIGCYVIMSFFIYFGVLRSRRKLLVCAALTLVLVLALGKIMYQPWYLAAMHDPTMLSLITMNYLLPSGTKLYLYFVAGILAYIYRDRIPFSHTLAAGCGAAMVLITVIGAAHFRSRLDEFLFVPLVTYLTVYIGMLEIPPMPLYKHGDYSYGIYLYGFPLQQAIIHLNGGRMNLLLHMALSLVLATCIAVVSWHVVEKPTLRLRKKFSFTARKGSEDPLSHTLPTATAEPEPIAAAQRPFGS